jgi:ADP-ribose pyrophosphatase YjhB (NUDIX family)
MNHRISAGAFVEHEGRLLLVRHRREGRYDFWVAPGGGVQGTEDLRTAAAREVKEETGLDVVAEKLVYVEEFYSPDTRHCKFWFTASLVGGTLSSSAPEAVAEHIIDASWHTEHAVKEMQVFPEALHARYWEDRKQGFPALQHLGLREMAFW